MLLAVLSATVGLVPGATTARAATFTYDVPTNAPVEIHGLHGALASPARRSDAWEQSASWSIEDRGASTIPGLSGVATEAAGVLDEAASGQVPVLGRFRGGTEEYLGKPGFNVLDLPSKGTGRWYWSRNEAFIDDAIAAGDEIRLVTNPYEPIYSGGNTFQREIRYLKDLGYTFQESGDHWVAVPGR